MADELDDDPFDMTNPDQDRLAQALGPGGRHDALGDRVHVRGMEQRRDDLHAGDLRDALELVDDRGHISARKPSTTSVRFRAIQAMAAESGVVVIPSFATVRVAWPNVKRA
ncbi:MAG: hypothetical protein IPM29_30585 [Planctomycetes bacterium]|nr:hypothetical protein [Planctomycetota bacterium]